MTQRNITTLAAAWRWRCGGGAQCDGGSAVAAARWMQRWRQRHIVTSAALGGSAAAAHSETAAGDGRGEGKGDRRCDGDDDATATECAMVMQRRQKAGRL